MHKIPLVALLLLFSSCLAGDIVTDVTDALQTVVKAGIEELYDEDEAVRIFNTNTFEFDPNAPSFPEGAITADSVGVALSGGGSRSLACSLGQLRALKANGIMNRVTHISAVSGGAWASTLWHYAIETGNSDKRSTDDELLNLVSKPEDLRNTGCTSGNSDPPTAANLEANKNNLGCLFDQNIGKAATRTSRTSLAWSAITQAFLNIFTDVGAHRFYPEWVRDTILEPYGINDERGWPYTKDATTRTQIVNENSRYSSTTFDQCRTNRSPVWIAVSGLIPNPASPYDILPFETTTLAAGVPATFLGKGFKGQDIGGGWVQPFAFDSQQYQRATLVVEIISAANLSDEDTIGNSDPFVQIRLDNVAINEQTGPNGGKTNTISDTQNPTWSETKTFTLDGITPNTKLQLDVKDEDTGPDEELGALDLDLRDIPVLSTPPPNPTTATLTGDGAQANSQITYRVYFSSFSGRTTNNIVNAAGRAQQYSLSDAIGSSSAQPALDLAADSAELNDVIIPRHTYWSPRAASFNQPYNIPATYNFVDGGDLDNSALIPLLVRRVQRVFSFINTRIPISQDTVNNQQVTVVDASIASLFGFQPKQPGQDYVRFTQPLIKPEYEKLSRNQVFPPEEFQSILVGLQSQVNNNKPVYIRKTLAVQINAHWGIAATYNVDIVFFYNHMNAEWRSRLSAEATTALNSITNFPHYDTTSQLQLSSLEVNMLANMWQTTLLADGSAATATTTAPENIISVLSAVAGTQATAPTGFNTAQATPTGGGTGANAPTQAVVPTTPAGTPTSQQVPSGVVLSGARHTMFPLMTLVVLLATVVCFAI